MRTVEFKMERPGLVSAGDKVKIIEREGTSSYSYIIDPAVAMSGCFAARDRIKSLEAKKQEILAPKPPRKPRKTKKQKIQEIVKLAMKNGMSVEEIADQLHVEVED